MSGRKTFVVSCTMMLSELLVFGREDSLLLCMKCDSMGLVDECWANEVKSPFDTCE